MKISMIRQYRLTRYDEKRGVYGDCNQKKSHQ